MGPALHKRWWTCWVTWFTSKQKTSDNIFSCGNPIGSYYFQQYSPIHSTVIEPEWSSDSCVHCHGVCTLNMNMEAEQSSKTSWIVIAVALSENADIMLVEQNHHLPQRRASVLWLYFKKMNVFLRGAIKLQQNTTCESCEFCSSCMRDRSSLIPWTDIWMFWLHLRWEDLSVCRGESEICWVTLTFTTGLAGDDLSLNQHLLS